MTLAEQPVLDSEKLQASFTKQSVIGARSPVPPSS
jgi:hypothetical protein